MKKVLLAFLLFGGCLQVKAFTDKDLRTSLEELEANQSLNFKLHYTWSKENLYAPCGWMYVKGLGFVNNLRSSVSFISSGGSLRDVPKLVNCNKDVLNMYRKFLDNQEDPAAREELIKEYEARYTECKAFVEELRAKIKAKEKAQQEAKDEKNK